MKDRKQVAWLLCVGLGGPAEHRARLNLFATFCIKAKSGKKAPQDCIKKVERKHRRTCIKESKKIAPPDYI
jgi:hypothetical protein